MNDRTGSRSVRVLFTPAEFATLRAIDLKETACVVFDILRATSTLLVALQSGAKEIIPVSSVDQALALKQQHPDALLAGERGGVRITAALARGTAFDFGNSPREFSTPLIRGRTIIMTTTNGTRALEACRGGATVWIGAFNNLTALARRVASGQSREILLVCAGTGETAALEDILAAGALCDRLRSAGDRLHWDDSALAASTLFNSVKSELEATIATSRNGRRLLAIPELAADVPICLAIDSHEVMAAMDDDGVVHRVSDLS